LIHERILFLIEMVACVNVSEKIIPCIDKNAMCGVGIDTKKKISTIEYRSLA